jgi:hypothetical protein
MYLVYSRILNLTTRDFDAKTHESKLENGNSDRQTDRQRSKYSKILECR